MIHEIDKQDFLKKGIKFTTEIYCLKINKNTTESGCFVCIFTTFNSQQQEEKPNYTWRTK